MNDMLSSSRHNTAVGTAYSIRSYLQLLIAAILVPMLVLVAYLAWHYGSASRRTIEAERLDVVSNLTHLIDREIKATSGFLTGIATSPGLQAGSAETQHRVTNVVLGAGFVGLGIFDPSNRLIFSEPAAVKPAFADPGAVGVAVPAAVVNAPLRETALSMAVIGLGLILLSVLLGSLVAARIAYGVRQLSHAAVGLASGDVVPLAVSRTAQISDVSHALEAAAAAAQRREAKRRAQ